jgi:NADPH:quinone reductase-like Zn-dependent oxidoreductase
MLPGIFKDELAKKAKAKGVNGYFFVVSSNEGDMQDLANLLEKGIIRSHVSEVFPFDKMKEAHRQIETGKTKGKIVVTV